MEVREIIERLECLRMVIAGAFTNGRIDFDAIVGELDAISGGLQAGIQAAELGLSTKPLPRLKDSRESCRLVNIAEYR